MSTQWTPEQLQAIQARDNNLLVAAGAGAGKTAVLVERIIGRITDPTDPVDVDRLLVVTFTNAAAAEMRERIGTAIAQQLLLHPDDAHLSRQLALLGRASIATIHSFCLDLLRQHFYRLELDPAFRVADVTEIELLKADVLEQLFETCYQSGDAEFLHLVDAYGGAHDDSQLQEMVLQLDDYAQSQPDPAGWLQRLPEQISNPLRREKWLQQLFAAAREQLLLARSALMQGLQIAAQPGGPEQYTDVLMQELEQIELLLDQYTQANDWDALQSALDAFYWQRLPGKRGGDVELREMAKQARNEAKETVQAVAAKLMAQSRAQLWAGLETVIPSMTLLCRLTSDFRIHYAHAKQIKGIVDFDDLEHMALRVLSDDGAPSAVAQELSQHYVEILVDEYQDINGVQEAILQLLTAPSDASSLFMVGDVKQSIYRFRLADPTLFLSKYNAFARDPQQGQRIDLTHNFRSRANVLHAVNFLFRQLMTERIGELVYDEAAELQAGAAYAQHAQSVDPAVEILLLERQQDSNSDSEEPGAELDAAGREARVIGQEIKQLVESQVHIWDKKLKAYRPVAYRDIVILMRATAGRANTFFEQMRELDVPAYAELGTGYFQATEVQVMLSLLQIIDNPRQDIPLAAVLRSPLVGLQGDELAQIRLAAPSGSYYSALLVASQQDDELGSKLRRFLTDLQRWRQQARRSKLSELVWQIYRDTGYYTTVGAMPGGAQRQANLRALHDRARQYEQTSFRGLFRFLRFIERLQDDQGDLGSARALGENEDVVRIMSVHKSKGLEFPIVFIAGLGNQFNLQDLRAALLIHKDLGLGPLAVDLQRRLRYPTLPRLVMQQQMRQEMLSEELRVLYVALTRAREKLYLVGSQRNLPQALQRWTQTASSPRSPQGALPEATLAQANSYLDWLGPAIVGHKDAAAVLAKAGIEPPTVPDAWQRDSSRWRLRCIDSAQLDDAQPDEGRAAELALVKQRQPLPDHGWSQAIAQQLDWTYPHAALRGQHIKVSVSELKHRYALYDEETTPLAAWQRPPLSRPAFMQQHTGLSPTEVGSAMHLFLQHVDLAAPMNAAYLTELKGQMQAQALLSQEEADSIDLEMVLEFFHSDIGQRLRQADRVWRELPFSLRLDAAELYGPEAADEYVYVQGIIDCIWQEGETAILLDFKSDNIDAAALEARAERYHTQIAAYARAIEELLHLPVSERYLYFLRLRRAVKM